MDQSSTRTETAPQLSTPGGSDALRLTVVRHPDAELLGVSRVLGRGPEILLGRSPRCGLPGALADPRISREHARLVRRGDVWHLDDLGSHNGTLLNGERVDDAPLSEGDVLTVGPVLLLLHRSDGAPRRLEHERFAGASEAMRRLLDDLAGAAPRDTPVLILGETGTGKELLAAEVHERSGRKGEFVAVNCSAVDDNVLASELFGHARGAFSGAVGPRRGLVETARGGTLFFDEIGDASPRFQQSLLRLLETGDYRPVGSDRGKKADVRCVFAAQPTLLQRVEAEQFRRDLWMRLARWVLRVPPLRDRLEDLPFLVERIAERAGAAGRIPDPALALALLRHPWPGNVRELEAVVGRALGEPGTDAMSITPAIEARLAESIAAMPAGEAGAATAAPVAKSGGERKRRPPAQRPEPEALQAMLAEHGGSVRATAKALGVERKTVYRWVRDLELDLDEVRDS